MSIIAIGVLCRRPPLIRTIPASLQGATCGPPRYIGMAPSEEGGRDNRPFVGRLILDPCNLKYLPSHFPPVSVSFQCYWRLPGLRTVVRVHALLLALHRSRPLLSSFVWFHHIRAHAPSSRPFVHPSTPVRIVGSNPLSGPVRFVLFQPRLPLVCAITTPTDLLSSPLSLPRSLSLSSSRARTFFSPTKSRTYIDSFCGDRPRNTWNPTHRLRSLRCAARHVLQPIQRGQYGQSLVPAQTGMDPSQGADKDPTEAGIAIQFRHGPPPLDCLVVPRKPGPQVREGCTSVHETCRRLVPGLLRALWRYRAPWCCVAKRARELGPPYTRGGVFRGRKPRDERGKKLSAASKS